MNRERELTRGNRAGFTLVEVVLVLIIVAFAMTVTFPMLGRSIAGNRVRTGARAVVTAGRYARSMAVLKQKEMALVFQVGSGKITVQSPEDGAVEFTREMDGAQIAEVQVGEGEAVKEGRGEARYRNNGTCTPYRVRVDDGRGRSIWVTVDALSAVETDRT